MLVRAGPALGCGGGGGMLGRVQEGPSGSEGLPLIAALRKVIPTPYHMAVAEEAGEGRA